ncbi:hypothetical protein COLO4_22517 [Corchorus olitorius]|uniref:DUF241 domain protein n=1 Tax=Corchorus olitorius TaxID=93759 RepID=A0A1R3ILK7_9ROSI|nr:hypothetical protein COLO4_22517 [Corchorus olitorius]
MVAFSSKSTKHYSVRSISFPARPHPSTIRMEEELNKLKAWQGGSSSNAETFCTGLLGLAELYTCIDDLLNSRFTQQALAQHHHEKWDNELLDCSLKHLDLCGKTRDAVLSMKQSARELQSALRRSKGGELSIESNISTYIRARKTMKKEIANCLASLKQMDYIFSDFPKLEQNLHLFVVAGLLREASLITASIFHSLLLFLAPSPLKAKPSKWSLVTKLVKKGLTTAYEEHQNMNELERVDVAVSNLLLQSSRDEDCEEERIQSAQVKLECLDAVFGGFEDALDCLFKSLIHTRVSLLNILSH